MSAQAPTPRTRVRRLPELGVYERERVHAILDEAIYCHLAWVGADGEPRVIPTIHARIDDTLYVHGSAASSTLRAIKQGLPVAIAVTIVDGIRFARSMFEHSMNYRTVIVYGRAEEVTDRDELRQVFDVDHRPRRAGAQRRRAGAQRRRAAPDHVRQGGARRVQREGERGVPRGARGATSPSTSGPASCRCERCPANRSPTRSFGSGTRPPGTSPATAARARPEPPGHSAGGISRTTKRSRAPRDLEHRELAGRRDGDERDQLVIGCLQIQAVAVQEDRGREQRDLGVGSREGSQAQHREQQCGGLRHDAGVGLATLLPLDRAQPPPRRADRDRRARRRRARPARSPRRRRP